MARIALIGYRGCGKSTVGPLLAAELGWRFIDADIVLEDNAGKSIARIFSEDGEPAFRILETRNLQSLLIEEMIVLATGGGIILKPENRRRLNESAFVAWLDASAEDCWARIQADVATRQRRPDLTAGGGFAEVVRLLAERRPLYAATAHLRVDADQSPERIAAAILQAWHSRATA